MTQPNSRGTPEWHQSGVENNFTRFLCWIFGCYYEEEIGGGWCTRCGADHGLYKPLWRRR